MEDLTLALLAIRVISVRPELFYRLSIIETYTSFSVHGSLNTSELSVGPFLFVYVL